MGRLGNFSILNFLAVYWRKEEDLLSRGKNKQEYRAMEMLRILVESCIAGQPHAHRKWQPLGRGSIRCKNKL